MLSVLDYSFFVEWLLHVIFIDPFRWQFAVGWTVLTYDPVSVLSLLLCVVIKYLLYKQWVTSATSLFKSFSLSFRLDFVHLVWFIFDYPIG